FYVFFFFSSRRRHTRSKRDWSSDVCSSDLFDIPVPDEPIFISWFEGGEVFRSGVTFKRGRGKIFYFQPGHESYPTYHHPMIQRVITNGVKWASNARTPIHEYGNHQPIEDIEG